MSTTQETFDPDPDALLDSQRCPRCGSRCKYEKDQNNHPLGIHTCPNPECEARWDSFGEVWYWKRTPRKEYRAPKN